MSLLSILFFALILAAGYHYLVENVIVPYLTDRTTMKLRILYDRLVRFRINHPERLSKDDFEQLRSEIRIAEKYAGSISVAKLCSQKRMKEKHPEIAKKLEELEQHNKTLPEEVKLIQYKFSKRIFELFIINLLGWGIYIVFPLLAVLAIVFIVSYCFRKLTQIKIAIFAVIRKSMPILFSDSNIEHELQVSQEMIVPYKNTAYANKEQVYS